MAAVVAGRARSNVSALNWSPKEGWLCQVPYTRRSSPSLTKGNIPTTVPPRPLWQIQHGVLVFVVVICNVLHRAAQLQQSPFLFCQGTSPVIRQDFSFSLSYTSSGHLQSSKLGYRR